MTHSPRLDENYEIISHLYSGYHARLLSYNVLDSLLLKGALKHKTAETEAILRQIEQWRDDLWNGKQLLPSQKEYDDSAKLRRAYRLISELARELLDQAQAVERILKTSDYARPSGRAKEKHCLGEASNLSQTDHQDPSFMGGVKPDKLELSPQEIIKLAVGYLRLASREVAMAKSTALLARNTQRSELLREAEATFTATAEMLKYAEQVLRAHSSKTGLDEAALSFLVLRAQLVPGFYRLQALDLRMLMGRARNIFTAGMLGLSPVAAERWSTSGFDLYEAAAWMTVDFSIEQAQRWREIGIGNPGLANMWHVYGFKAEQAFAYLSVALIPEQAAALARFGISDPDICLRLAELQPDTTQLLRRLHAGDSVNSILQEHTQPVNDAADETEASETLVSEDEDLFRKERLNSLARVWLRYGVSGGTELKHWVSLGVRDPRLIPWLRKRAATVFKLDQLRGQTVLDVVKQTIAPLPPEPCWIVCWGIYYASGSVPWQEASLDEQDATEWIRRFTRNAEAQQILELDCCIGRGGRMAEWQHFYAAPIASERCSREKPTAKQLNSPAPAQWLDSLSSFCEIMRLKWETPRWHAIEFVP